MASFLHSDEWSQLPKEHYTGTPVIDLSIQRSGQSLLTIAKKPTHNTRTILLLIVVSAVLSPSEEKSLRHNTSGPNGKLKNSVEHT